MYIELDLRGQACPQPVIAVKQQLDKLGLSGGTVMALVDQAAARENISRLAIGLGCEVEVLERDGEWRLQIRRKAAGQETALAMAGASVVVVLAGETMGRGSDELGAVLMRSFLHTVDCEPQPPAAVLLYNSGVKLALAESPCLELLQSLAAKGSEVQSCGTCLDYYNSKEHLAVGRVTNMYDILQTMKRAACVVAP